MRYRKLDSAGDMVFGHGQQDFFTDSIAAVAQLVQTRLGLQAGEWFLDVSEGTPYSTQIRGRVPQRIADSAIRARVLGTEGVTAILEFSSSLVDRKYSAALRIDTQFGIASVST